MTVPSAPRLPDGSVDDPANWRWMYADEAGIAMSEPDITFTSQQEAEDWLGDQFEQLSADGVAAVTLMDGEHAVYGPMFLTADGDGAAAEAEF
jgi:hypothetical protein